MKIKSIKKAGNSFPAFSMNWYDWFSENGSLWEHEEVLHLSASQNPNTPHKYNQLQNHAKIIIVHAIWGHPTQSTNNGPWIRGWWLFPSHLKKDHVAVDFCPQIFTCIQKKYLLWRSLKNE